MLCGLFGKALPTKAEPPMAPLGGISHGRAGRTQPAPTSTRYTSTRWW